MPKKFQRGQVLVFYAFLLPIIFLFAGVGIDFGWYYMNVSRLQNAADAAALAGAGTICYGSSAAFEDYYPVRLAKDKLPGKEDFDSYKTVTDKNLRKYKLYDEVKPTLQKGSAAVEKYTRLNLTNNSTDLAESADTAKDDWETFSTTDGWSISISNDDRKVDGSIDLKVPKVRIQNDVKGLLYYEVNLNEKIRHLFLPGWFEDMQASVKSVVLLQPRDTDLTSAMEELKRDNTIPNWEYQNVHKNDTKEQDESHYFGKWNHYKAGKENGTFSNERAIRYTDGNDYRSERVDVTTEFSTGSAERTQANGGKFYSADEVDALNIDARADITVSHSRFGGYDWDIGQELSGFSYSFNKEPGYTWDFGYGDDKRILLNVEFNDNFQTRNNKVIDPLWVGIESDPIKNINNGTVYNSVREFILNFNTDNTATEIIGENKRYKYRPYVIFYEGPETINEGIGRNGSLVRYSRPVIINLNEDLNAIFYLPNSPAIINGNAHKLTGFIIARCFLQSLTSDDMTGNGKITLYDGFNPTQKFKGNCIEGIDGYGNTVYVHKDDLYDIDAVNKVIEKFGATPEQDSNGTIPVYDEQPTKYLFINYTKADSEFYEQRGENTAHDENKTFAAYINATYKETFMSFSGLNEAEITAVNFPDENNNETTATYYVKTDDLCDTSKGDNYVKVLADGVTKYVDKTKLPYVKIRTGKDYFYVCVYDLKLTTPDNKGKGVRMIEEGTDTDIFVNPKNINRYGDSWEIDRAWFNSGKYNDWKKDKLTFYNNVSPPYFVLNSELEKHVLVAKYRKITVDGKELYFDELKTDYYSKVAINEHNPDNYIIVDKNGNILTKPITAPEIVPEYENFKSIYDKLYPAEKYDELIGEYDKLRSTCESLQNGAKLPFGLASKADFNAYWNKYTRETKNPEEFPIDDSFYLGKNGRHAYNAYRIPVFERVYSKSCFNLSDDSRYSYFQIQQLQRTNYNYMEVNELKDDSKKVEDMFFTSIRASWID